MFLGSIISAQVANLEALIFNHMQKYYPGISWENDQTQIGKDELIRKIFRITMIVAEFCFIVAAATNIEMAFQYPKMIVGDFIFVINSFLLFFAALFYTCPQLQLKYSSASALCSDHHDVNALQSKLECATNNFLKDFARFSSNTSNNLKSHKFGGIDVVLNAMKNHNDNANIQKHGCHALCNLSYDDDENKNIIQVRDGIHIIIDAMKNHANIADVQENGCAVLCNLSFDHTVNQGTILSLGGIHAIVDAMKNHINTASVQEFGCEALVNFELNTIMIPNLLMVIIDAMKTYTHVAPIQENGCEALLKLTYNNIQNEIKIRSLGGVEIILDAMKNHTNDADVQENACTILHYLTCENTAAREQLLSLGGKNTIMKAMKNHASIAVIQTCGKNLLRRFEQ